MDDPEYHASVKNLWMDLKVANRLFNEEKRLPVITFLDNGRHCVK